MRIYGRGGGEQRIWCEDRVSETLQRSAWYIPGHHQGEQQSADLDAAESYPVELHRLLQEGGTMSSRFTIAMRQDRT